MTTPRIYIDYNGTLHGNPDVSDEAALQALYDLGRNYEARICSSDPRGVQEALPGVDVIDKLDLFSSGMPRGNYLVDDEEKIRACWERCGGHAVAASDLVRFAERMTGR